MCPWCQGRLKLLGKLGERYFFRCRSCGGDSNSERANIDLEGGESS